MSVKYPNYVNLTSLSDEQPNEKTHLPPPRQKSLSSPRASSKSISSKSTHYTSSSSPITTASTRVKNVSESYYCQYKEVTISQVEVSAAQELQENILSVYYC
uniref:Uncharacterized protein n=1 Tax=Tanacetum cinerariifolium TaxID=118510 RepID=A0A6L2NE25_TANCI|nr:hypothetical protein [Tanacetum cinerariifolium]